MTLDERIYNQAITDGIPPALAVLLVAQARHETGNYTSNVFKSCSNAYGYKYVGQATAEGACTMSPEGNNYARYRSVEQSVTEVTLWIKRRQREGKFPANLGEITTPEQYAQLLKNCGYYGSTWQVYANGMLAALQKIGDLVTSAKGVGLLIIIALGFVAFKDKFK